MDQGTSGLLRHAGAPPGQGARTVDRAGWLATSNLCGFEKRLRSLHPTSRERSDEAQQRDETIAVAAAEAFDEGDRQSVLIDRRHDPPERSRGETVPPPPAPALNGAVVDADCLSSSRMRHSVAPCRRIAISTTIAATWRARPMAKIFANVARNLRTVRCRRGRDHRRAAELVECGIGQQVSMQRTRPPRLEGADHNGQARTQ
jgi:hypothetical protein